LAEATAGCINTTTDKNPVTAFKILFIFPVKLTQ
jgi:hypothetical protein